MGLVISYYNKRLILLSVIQLSGGISILKSTLINLCGSSPLLAAKKYLPTLFTAVSCRKKVFPSSTNWRVSVADPGLGKVFVPSDRVILTLL